MAAAPSTRSDEPTGGVRPHVELVGIVKDFGGVRALRGVDVKIRPGEVHALVGENGAGKSTIGKIIAGVHRPTSGDLLVDGSPVSFRSPREALMRGLTIIAQELSLVPARSVLENVLLGREPNVRGVVHGGDARRAYDALLEEVGFDFPANARVGDLSLAERQKVEILRAVARDARLIVMDEPTAALSRPEAEVLLSLIRRLRGRGITIVYVSHFLEDVLAIADTVTTMRDGERVRTSPSADETVDSLVLAMLGRSLERTFPDVPSPPADAPVVCRVRGLSRPPAFEDVSLEVHAGEILGVAGLVGSGRSEIARAIAGVDRPTAGTVEVDNELVDTRHPWRAMRAGVAMVPESRKDQGLVMIRSIADNVSFADPGAVSVRGVISRRRERARTAKLIERLQIRPADPRADVLTLSGGNQQKVLFAKWMNRDPSLFIVDEPTRGVDVGAKLAIYELLVDLARRGVAILLISSDLEEVLGLAHRIAIVRRGRLVQCFDRSDADQHDVLSAALSADGHSMLTGGTSQ